MICLHFASLFVSFWVFTILYLHSLSPFWKRFEFLYAIFFFSELAYSFAIVNHSGLLHLLFSFSWLLCIVLTTLVTWFPILCVVSAFFNFYLNTTVLFYPFLFRFSQKKPAFRWVEFVFEAERAGFEPADAFTSLVFKTRAINHSTTSPYD